MTKYSIIAIFLICHVLPMVIRCEVYYIGLSRSPNNADHHHLTLPQFVKNSSNYLTNDTQLIFAPGNYSLESEILIENVQSFSISVEPNLLSRVVLLCDHNTRFEFSNISTVTLSGLDLDGCFENHIVSVNDFVIQNLRFHGQAMDNGTILTIEESTAILDRVSFISTVDSWANLEDNITLINSSESCPTELLGRAIVILSRRSVIIIKQSWFEGNNMGPGRIIESYGSDIIIFNTTFINNSAATYCYNNCCFTGSIVYASGSQGSTLKLCDTKIVHNLGVVIFTFRENVLISHCEFINNSAPFELEVVYVSGSIPIIRIYAFCILLALDTNITIGYTEFVGNDVAVSIAYVTMSRVTNIDHTKFFNNVGCILDTRDVGMMKITHNEFVENSAQGSSLVNLYGHMITLSHNKFVNNTATRGLGILIHNGEIITLSHSIFLNNTDLDLLILYGEIITLSHNKFVNNTATTGLGLLNLYGEIITLSHSIFVNNTAITGSVNNLYGDIITLSHSEFINNRAYTAIVLIIYSILGDNLTINKNDFTNNSAAFGAFISSDCKPGFSLSLGSPRCIKCSLNWQKNVTIIVIVSIVAGIAIVIGILAINMTVAIGTLNGILFYANILAANTDTYFFPFSSSNFVTIFVSWLNLEIGFDICIYEGMNAIIKALIQLVFPFYIICLVIIVIVASECSSKFAKIIGKGNPVAVLATMILISYTQFLNAIFGSVYLLYYRPAYGSRKVDLTILDRGVASLKQESESFKIYSSFLIVICVLMMVLVILFTVLVTFWQWLVRYQDKVICKWVKYQKLRHFFEPYNAPYTAKYRYWTGLLLFVRVVLSLISSINFSFDDPQIPVELISTTVVIGCLLLLKGVIANRIYKNWPLDVIETAIYFNLLAFSALTWYNVSSQASENQIAVAYTSVMITFILFLGVITFHVFRYTRLYKCSLVEKAFKWISSNLMEKRKQPAPNDSPEELDGYQLERLDDQEIPAVTYSVVEIPRPAQDQEENETAY